VKEVPASSQLVNDYQVNYASLLDGISRAFIMAKEIFRFRKPKPPKLAPTIDELLNKRSLGMMP